MKILDVRCRPPFQPYLDTMYNSEDHSPFSSFSFPMRFGMNVAESVKTKSLDVLFEEMDRCGDFTGVVSIRKNSRGYENDALVDLLAEHSDRFLGACGVPTSGGEASVELIKKYIVDGPCIAPFMEPGMEGYFMDDEIIFPIYEYCEKNNIPMLISFGGFHGPTAEYCDATRAANVAHTFPNLKMALCHGGWPLVGQAVRVCFSEPNVYLSPDIYGLHALGGNDYIEAANYMLRDKFLYGSAYPCVDIEGSVKYYLEHLREEVVEDIMYNNAARFFGLTE